MYSGSQKKLASSRESHTQLNANAQMFLTYAMRIRAYDTREIDKNMH